MNEAEPAGDDEFGLPVHVIPKSAREQVRISINEYRGFNYIDIRQFYLSDGGYRPSKKGVTLRKDLYPELFRGIMQLGETLGFDDEALAAALDESNAGL